MDNKSEKWTRFTPADVWPRYRRALDTRNRRLAVASGGTDPLVTFPPDPQWLFALPQWVVWRLEDAGRPKPAKMPYGVDGKRAEANRPATWLTLPVARERLASGSYAGIGFEFYRDDPFTFVDLDGCRDPATGVVAPWALAIVERLASFTEVSQSGRGLHIIARGQPAWAGKEGGRQDAWQGGAVEVYSGGHFAALTFDMLPGYYDVSEVDQTAALEALCREVGIKLGSEVAGAAPTLTPPRNADLSDDDVRARIAAGPDGRAFHRLTSVQDPEELLGAAGKPGVYKSLSDADWDLARIFIREVGGDVDRVEALMRATPLARKKWDQHRTYLRGATIEKAALSFGAAAPPEAGAAVGLRGVSDLAVLTQPDPPYLVDGYLLANGLNTIYGRWGAGKTFVQLDWLLHVAAGLPWQGRKVAKGPTLLVYAEGAMRSRVAAWRVRWNVDPTAAVGLTLAPGTVNLLDARAVEAFLRQLAAGDLGPTPALIAFETLARSIPGGDENSAETMSRVVASAGQIQRETGAAVSITHHTPWEAKRLRGSTVLGDAADSAYLLENANPDAARTDPMTLTLTCQKLREGEWPAPLHLRLAPRGASRVIEPDPTGGRSADDEATALATIRANPGCGLNVLEKAIGGRPKRTADALENLALDSKIENRGTGKKHAWYAR